MTAVLTAVDAPAAGPAPNLPAMVVLRALETPDRTAVRRKQRGIWRSYSWGEVAARMQCIARGLHELGVAPGDRVAIQSWNRPAWLFTDLAAQALGAATVGVHPDASPTDLAEEVTAAGAVLLLAEDEEQVDKALLVRKNLRGVRRVVVVDPRGVDVQDELVMTLAEVESRGSRSEADIDASIRAIDLDGPALSVDGQLIDHRTLVAAGVRAAVAGVGQRSEVLSYLPLSGLEERIVTMAGGIVHGGVVAFGESGASLPQDLREVQPTVLVGVASVWAALAAEAERRMAEAGWVKQHAYRARTSRALGWTVRAPIRAQLGLARARCLLTGPGALDADVAAYFAGIGAPIEPLGDLTREPT